MVHVPNGTNDIPKSATKVLILHSHLRPAASVNKIIQNSHRRLIRCNSCSHVVSEN